MGGGGGEGLSIRLGILFIIADRKLPIKGIKRLYIQKRKMIKKIPSLQLHNENATACGATDG